MKGTKALADDAYRAAKSTPRAVKKPGDSLRPSKRNSMTEARSAYGSFRR